MADDPLERLAAIQSHVDAAFGAVHDEPALRNVYAKFLGREGSLTLIMKRMGDLAPTDRKAFGQRVNQAKQAVEAARESTEKRLVAAERQRELDIEPLDVTLPGRPIRTGKIHPVMRVLHDIVDVFVGLGFDVAEGPEVDSTLNNFEHLGFPADHPAMDMQDTFFVDGGDPAVKALLRTHTSPVQIREMLSHPPPVMMIAPGVTYRRDDDATHSPMFMQVEGLVVDRGITMAHLKGTLDAFVHRMFGPDIPTRLRSSYFPFTEPSAELDMGCQVCLGKDPTCRVCKGSGWMEFLGCGMVDPVVLSNVGYDPEVYTGFAFGMGVDRQAMQRYGIPHIRLLYENDVRFLRSL